MPEVHLLCVDAAAFGDRRELAKSIAAAAPNVAVVHGAPSLLRWRSACAAIARDAAMVVVGGGRTAGGALVICDLGVDVEASNETGSPHRLALHPPGLLVTSMRRLGAPFVLAAGRLESGARRELDDAIGGIDAVGLHRPPRVVALAGEGCSVDERITAETADVPGGSRITLKLDAG